MLDDLFETAKRSRNAGHDGYDNHRGKYENDSYGNQGYRQYNPLLNMAQKILRNKVLLAAIVFIILIIGAIGVWVIIKILPYLGQILSLVEKQGIKGIVEMITPLLQKIWEGAGK